MISYSKQNISLRDIFEVIRVLRSSHLTQGPLINEFEKAICQYTGAKYAVVTMNATVALHLAMKCLNLSDQDEVITTPITFVATSNAALYVGAKVVFADINPEDANISVSEIEKKIGNKTKVLVPVHFAGQSCDMQKISYLAKKHNLYVIEDAAHAIGSEYRGKKVGSCEFSDMAVFSFHAVKNITSGEGGAITTNSKQIYEKLIQLRSHGITKKTAEMSADQGPWFYEMQNLGFNYRMTDIQAALGISQLKRLERFTKRKNEIIEKYKYDFKDISEISFLRSNDSLTSYHLCVALVDFAKLGISRSYVFEELKKKNIFLQVHYIPVYLQPYYQQLGFKKGDFPCSEQYYDKCISLPMYSSLSERKRGVFVNEFRQILLKKK